MRFFPHFFRALSILSILPTTHRQNYQLLNHNLHIHILHPTGIPTPENAKNHTRGFAQGARTEAAHAAALRTAALLARTAFRVHADGAFCARVRAAYEAGATAAGAAGTPPASAPTVGTGAASRNSAHRRGTGPSH